MHELLKVSNCSEEFQDASDCVWFLSLTYALNTMSIHTRRSVWHSLAVKLIWLARLIIRRIIHTTPLARVIHVITETGRQVVIFTLCFTFSVKTQIPITLFTSLNIHLVGS